MRVIVYKDIKIPQDAYDKVMWDYADFMQKHAGLPKVFVTTVDYDFTDYPTVLDSDGDDVMRPDFWQKFAKEVTTKYGDYGYDNVITLVHQDNWKSGKTATRKGIWGQNLSYKHGNYHMQYCRWDKKNPANTFGTINHEIDHTFDALIKVEIGVDINKILGVTAYDNETTHGSNPRFKYIRYQENAYKLQIIGPYLVSAYRKRVEKHEIHIKGLQNTAIGLLERLVGLYKQRLYQKNGNPKK
jgi:hypothetical protein